MRPIKKCEQWSNGRDLTIDLIKIIAMLGVISLHCNMDRLDNMVAFVISRIAGISIPLFFMVSGYLLLEKGGDWRYSFRKILGIIKYVFLCSLVFSFFYVIVHQQFNINVFGIFLRSFIQKGPLWMFWYFGAMCLLYMLLPLLKWADKRWDYFYPKMFACLLCVDFMVFILTFAYRWEYDVIQSFRLWNWLTYFSLGLIIHKYNIHISVNTLVVLASAFLFVGFVYCSRKNIDGIEYFFTTPLCMMYATLFFVKIHSMHIQNNLFISKLSNLFLPVYTIHYFVIKAFRDIMTSQYIGIWTPLFDYLAITIITLLVCYMIMEVPMAKRFFRI
jgi:surface polysaccharide O-acyltransferase-like enzyme